MAASFFDSITHGHPAIDIGIRIWESNVSTGEGNAIKNGDEHVHPIVRYNAVNVRNGTIADVSDAPTTANGNVANKNWLASGKNDILSSKNGEGIYLRTSIFVLVTDVIPSDLLTVTEGNWSQANFGIAMKRAIKILFAMPIMGKVLADEGGYAIRIWSEAKKDKLTHFSIV